MNYKPLANWDAPPSNSYSRGSWHIKKKKLKLHGCIRYTNIYEPLFYWGPPFTWFEQPILNRCCTFVCLCMSLLAMYLSSCMSYIILYLHDIFFFYGIGEFFQPSSVGTFMTHLALSGELRTTDCVSERAECCLDSIWFLLPFVGTNDHLVGGLEHGFYFP